MHMTHTSSALPAVRWQTAEGFSSAVWLSANGRPAPKSVIEVDDRLTADEAMKHASQGTAMLWRGDFHGARQILSALDRRASKRSTHRAPVSVDSAEFYRIRQARAQRSRVLSLLLVPVEIHSRGGSVPLSRAPELGGILEFGYGEELREAGVFEALTEVPAVVSLQELIGVMSAHQWWVKGVEVPSLGAKIHPRYGTFLPTRHEYVDLVAAASPDGGIAAAHTAFDIGTGTGVLAAVLAKRGVRRVLGTDIHQRAVDCANDNFARLGISGSASAHKGSMFPEGRADLIVCNPPWLPGSAPTSLDAAVYDPGSKMLLDFIAGLPAHLTDGGEGWLVLSDLAELLGLRSREVLLEAISAAGLIVVDRLDTSPRHRKVSDSDDPLHAVRARETTSLWRLKTT